MYTLINTIIAGSEHQASVMEQPINQPMHSAHQECQSVQMAYLVSPLEHLQPMLSFTCLNLKFLAST